jgi:phthalate 4,5-cis-dihydrodiol dehydrogenase
MDTARGGGVAYIQAPHQVDVLRLIGGGLVRSVRAMAGVWDAERPTEGSFTAYLEFQDGTPATMVYSGYGYFDSAELHHWVGERGQPRAAETNARTHASYRARRAEAASDAEAAGRDAARYGGTPRAGASPDPPHQFFFGLTLVSCQRGDLRQSADGVYVYDAHGRHEVAVPTTPTGNDATVDAVYEAVAHDRPPLHDGRWGRATLEVCTSILQSARERREIYLTRQTPVRETM